MLHVVESAKPLDQLGKDLEAACARHKFGVLGMHDLKAKMTEKACRSRGSAGSSKSATRTRPRGSSRPTSRSPRRYLAGSRCTRKAGRPSSRTIRPTALIELYRNPELKGVAEEVERTLAAIMVEAARG